MPAFRSVVSVLVSFVGRSFSTNSRPALRAASGRPPARQPHDGHRVAGLTLTRGDRTRRRASAGHAAILGVLAFLWPDPVTVCVDVVTVPDPETVKYRVHLDLATTSAAHQAELVARLQEFGATPADVGQGDVPWTVLADPEGNEFCVLAPLTQSFFTCGSYNGSSAASLESSRAARLSPSGLRCPDVDLRPAAAILGSEVGPILGSGSYLVMGTTCAQPASAGVAWP
jgi:Glyoxalase-like domain